MVDSRIDPGIRIASWPLTARPFNIGLGAVDDGDGITDEYTRVSYQYSATDNRWVAVGQTRKPFTLYINPLAGNDGASGDASNPLATLQEAIRRLPPSIKHFIHIDLADNSGLPLTYNEQVSLINLQLEQDIQIDGKDRLFPASTGPNVIPANPANSGTHDSWTVPGANWTPNELKGKFCKFTAGPHAAILSYVSILGNTADTLYLGTYGSAFAPSYGPTDAAQIRELTTRIQCQTPNVYSTLTISEIGFGNTPGAPGLGGRIRFWYIHLVGDVSNKVVLEMTGRQAVFFDRCRIDDYWYATYQAVGWISFSESLIWTTANGRVQNVWDSSPDSTMAVSFMGVGLVGGLAWNNYSPKYASISLSNWRYDPIISSGALIKFLGGYLSLGSSSLNGLTIGKPIEIWSKAEGTISLVGGIIENSSRSGIQTKSGVLAKTTIIVEDYSPAPDIRSNAEYGISLEGPAIVETYKDAKSTVPNGIGGLRMRNGVLVRTNGASIPTMSGLAGQIDFDGRSPILWLPWSTDATGLETLCRLIRSP